MRAQRKREREWKTRVNFPMDLTLSSRIKAIFTKVFCTFFTPSPSIRAICRPTGALLRSTRFRHGSIRNGHWFRHFYQMTTRLNVALPNVPGIKSLLRSSSARLLHRGSIFQLAATNGSATPWKTDTICLFLPPSLFPSILISISRIPSSNRPTFIPHFIFPIVSDLSKIPFNRYHSTMSLCLLLSSFSYLFPFFRYSNHSFPQDPPQFLDFCSILLSSFSLLSFSLFNFSSPKIPI